jgi:hypothetical protein
MLLGNMDELHILRGIHLYYSTIDEKNRFQCTNTMGCYYNEWNIVSNTSQFNSTKININDIYVDFPLLAFLETQYISYKTFLIKKYHELSVNHDNMQNDNIFKNLPFNIIEHIFVKTLQECPRKN